MRAHPRRTYHPRSKQAEVVLEIRLQIRTHVPTPTEPVVTFDPRREMACQNANGDGESGADVAIQGPKNDEHVRSGSWGGPGLEGHVDDAAERRLDSVDVVGHLLDDVEARELFSAVALLAGPPQCVRGCVDIDFVAVRETG